MLVSERRICRVPGQHRSTQRKVPRGADDEAALTEDIIALARQYGRYGYRRVTALPHAAGWTVNHKRVERIWRREGLKVPQRRPKRGRLWLNDGSCIRLRPEYADHVWAEQPKVPAMRSIVGMAAEGLRFRSAKTGPKRTAKRHAMPNMWRERPDNSVVDACVGIARAYGSAAPAAT